MKRVVHIGLLAALATSSLIAQGAPQGWKQRIDRSTNASDPDAAGTVKFVSMGNGFHATNPQAAVYWNPANTATGNYTLKGTFILQKPSIIRTTTASCSAAQDLKVRSRIICTSWWLG